MAISHTRARCSESRSDPGVVCRCDRPRCRGCRCGARRLSRTSDVHRAGRDTASQPRGSCDGLPRVLRSDAHNPGAQPAREPQASRERLPPEQPQSNGSSSHRSIRVTVAVAGLPCLARPDRDEYAPVVVAAGGPPLGIAWATDSVAIVNARPSGLVLVRCVGLSCGSGSECACRYCGYGDEMCKSHLVCPLGWRGSIHH